MTTRVRERTDGAYWDRVTRPHRRAERSVWREYCDDLHRQLLDRSLDDGRVGRAFKTDLFDEATHRGLVSEMARRADEVHATDIAPEVLRSAAARSTHLRSTLADVRSLPYREQVFDQVVSNSTLDHFPERTDLDTALDELHRVLVVGGALVITMDNLANPVIRLRSILPHRLLRGLRLVPYFVGVTVTEAGLVDALERAGFTVRSTGTVMHAPRALTMAVCRLVDTRDRPRVRRRLLRLLQKVEALERWPTRRLTGYYITAVATRPAAARRRPR